MKTLTVSVVLSGQKLLYVSVTGGLENEIKRQFNCRCFGEGGEGTSCSNLDASFHANIKIFFSQKGFELWGGSCDKYHKSHICAKNIERLRGET